MLMKTSKAIAKRRSIRKYKNFDVAPELILKAVQEHHIKLVGLSALMTTTVVYNHDPHIVLCRCCRCYHVLTSFMVTYFN